MSGTANLVFNHSSPNYDFAPIVGLAMNIKQVGKGTTILTGQQNPLGYQTGTTSVTAGALKAGAEASSAHFLRFLSQTEAH